MILLWAVFDLCLFSALAYWIYRGYRVWCLAQYARVQTGHGEPLLDSKVMECGGFAFLLLYVFFASNSIWFFGPDVAITKWYWTASVVAIFFATGPVIFFHELAYHDLVYGRPSHRWGQVAGLPFTILSFIVVATVTIANSIDSNYPQSPLLKVTAGQVCLNSSLPFETTPIDHSEQTVSVIVATVYDKASGDVVKTIDPVWLANQYTPNSGNYTVDLTGLPAGDYYYVHNILSVGDSFQQSTPGLIVDFELLDCESGER